MANQHRPVTQADRDEILRLAREGLNNKQIGRRIDRYRGTVARVLEEAGWDKGPNQPDPHRSEAPDRETGHCGAPPVDASALEAHAAAGARVDEVGKRPFRMWCPEQNRFEVYLRTQHDPIRMTLQEADRFAKAYSRDGDDQTRHEVAVSFGLSRADVADCLTAFGLTHASLPFTDETISVTPEDTLVEDLLRAKEGRVRTRADRAWWAQVEADAERYQKLRQGLFDPLADLVEQHLPSYRPPTLKLRRSEGRRLWVVPVFDLHCGQHGWQDEVGEHYSFAEARQRLLRSTERIVTDLASRGEPTRIVALTGGDWFHIDTDGGTTTKNTRVDQLGTLAQVIHEGCDLAVDFIELLRQVGRPVHVYCLAGNHDFAMTHCLRQRLLGHYRNDPDVAYTWSVRDYEAWRFGRSSFLATHGDQIARPELRQKIQTELRPDFGQTRFSYLFHGHLHTKEVEEPSEGMMLIRVPALAGRSRYEAKHGWRHQAALCGYDFHEDEGLVGEAYTAWPRPPQPPVPNLVELAELG